MGRYTQYTTFPRLVRARYMPTALAGYWIRWTNIYSILGGSIAVKNTIYVRALTNRPNQAIAGWKSFCEFNIIWHSSTIIRSNRRIYYCRFKNVWKSGSSLDLGVTSIIAASSGGHRLSYDIYRILSC